MGKFCINCGAKLTAGNKFCIKCGAKISPLVKEAEFPSEQGEKSWSNLDSITAITEVKNAFTSLAPAYQAAGEVALPAKFTPIPPNLSPENIFSLFKGGLSNLIYGFKRSLSDKKRLVPVTLLIVIWLVVNFLAALGIFPLPVRILSWLTLAQGSLIGGTIAKGLLAALLTQFLVDKEFLSQLKKGLGQLSRARKKENISYAPLLLGLGLALIICNLMVSSTLQNTMAALAAFVLSARALTQKGFLRRLISSLMPQINPREISPIMQGLTGGFALFILVSLLPGGLNGFIIGLPLLIIGSIMLLSSGKQEKQEVDI